MFRRHERTKLDLYINKIVGDEPHLVRVRDISAGGVRVHRLLEPEQPTSRVALELQLPDGGDVIWASGEVVRQTGDEQAIRFTRIADADRHRLQSFVSSLNTTGHQRRAA